MVRYEVTVYTRKEILKKDIFSSETLSFKRSYLKFSNCLGVFSTFKESIKNQF